MSDIKAEVRQVPCNQIVWQLCNVSLQAGQAFSNAVDASQTCDKRCVLHVSKDPLGRQQHLHTDVHALPDSCCWGERLRSLFRSTAVRARPGTCLSPVSSIHVIWRRCAFVSRAASGAGSAGMSAPRSLHRRGLPGSGATPLMQSLQIQVAAQGAPAFGRSHYKLLLLSPFQGPALPPEQPFLIG